MDKIFSVWLQEQIDRLGISQSEFARRAGISRQAISNYINGQRMNPDGDTLEAIARALKLPPETVFRAAGLLPPVSEDEAKFEDWKYLLEGLNERDLNLLRDLAEKMAAENEKERALKSLNPRRVGSG